MAKPTLLVMAAGIGSRYGGLKQIDPVGPNDEIILDYSIHDAIRAGFGRVVFVIRRDIEKDFRSAIGERFEKQIDVRYAFQQLDALPAGCTPPDDRSKPWGTGHAVLSAAKEVDTPVVVINADDFYGAQSFAVISDYLSKAEQTNPVEYCMVGFTLRNTLSEAGSVSRGVCQCDENGFLASIAEHGRIERDGQAAKSIDASGAATPMTGDEVVSMNFWGFMPDVFGHLETLFARFVEAHGQELKSEFHIPAAVDDLMSQGIARVRVLPTPETWCGVTYPEDKPRVKAHMAGLVDKGVYKSPL